MLNLDRKSLPENSGVYIFKDKLENIIYIGKAKNIRKRVSSYFSSNHINSPKTQFLVKNIENIEFIVVDNETEALLLENRLIKKHKPKYNIDLKDSKTYAYIKISDEKIPKIMSARKISKKGFFYGPYTDGALRREVFRLCVHIFRLVTKQTFSSKSSLNYEIGISPARKIDDINLEEYLRSVDLAKDFLSGNTSKVLRKLKYDMKRAAADLHFEVARDKKRQIQAIKELREKQKVDVVKKFDQDIVVLIDDDDSVIIQILHISKGTILSKKDFRFKEFDDFLFEDFIKMYYSSNYVPKEIVVNVNFWKSNEERKILESYLTNFRGSKVSVIKPIRGDRRALVNLAIKNATITLKSGSDVLSKIKEKIGLKKIPFVIDCFDMSNLGSDFLVGGMTRFAFGKPDKKNYRRFQIKSFSGKNDDFAAMREVVYRKYSNKRLESKDYPDLIIVDGGKGQLRSAINALKELNLKIPVISLAKRDEEIFILGRKDSLKFDKNSSMMLFIRNIRDKTHNYVISYNRKKREMRFRDEIM